MASGLYLGAYDPEKLIVLLDDREVYGFAEGDMVVVEKSADFSTEYVGSKGEVSRAINRDVTGTITIRLQHNSPFIKTIEEWANADFPPVINFSVVDPASYEKFGSALCWLKTDSTHNFGNEIGEREVVFFTNQIRRGSPNLNLFSSLAYAAFQGLS